MCQFQPFSHVLPSLYCYWDFDLHTNSLFSHSWPFIYFSCVNIYTEFISVRPWTHVHRAKWHVTRAMNVIDCFEFLHFLFFSFYSFERTVVFLPFLCTINHFYVFWGLCNKDNVRWTLLSCFSYIFEKKKFLQNSDLPCSLQNIHLLLKTVLLWWNWLSIRFTSCLKFI